MVLSHGYRFITARGKKARVSIKGNIPLTYSPTSLSTKPRCNSFYIIWATTLKPDGEVKIKKKIYHLITIKKLSGNLTDALAENFFHLFFDRVYRP